MQITEQQAAALAQLRSSGPGRAASAPSAQDSSSNSSSGTSNASITADDFLTLLVSEMKNQDPTSNQDPNEYINQLVQVNSLEQLIQINTDLGGNSSTPTSSGSVVSGPAGNASARTATRGNLSAGGTEASAQRVATALSRHATAQSGTASGMQAEGAGSAPSLPTAGSDLRAYIMQRLHQQ